MVKLVRCARLKQGLASQDFRRHGLFMSSTRRLKGRSGFTPEEALMRPRPDLPSCGAVSSPRALPDEPRRAPRLAAVLILALGCAGALGAQQAQEPKEIEGLKAQFEALLKEQDARHQAEIEALKRTIADLSARVQQLQAERASSLQPPAAPATLAPPAVQPASPAPPPVPTVAAMRPPEKELPPEGRPLSATIPINVYGSLRFKSAADSSGTSEIQDNSSRIGLKAEMPLGDTSATVYARAEVGMRLIKNDASVVLHPDPAGTTATANNVFSARLGYVGFRTPGGTATWGRQWSVYYDIGGWTDQFAAWGGEAQGTYNAGTDGSPSGTGRVDQALIYRTPNFPLKLGLQVQNRSLTTSELKWGDTLAASLRWEGSSGLGFGAAYVDVRDGVRAPKSGQPKAGDRSFIAGAKFFRDPLYVALTYADFKNHEKDDAGTWFSGHGYELYAQYAAAPRWFVYGGFNALEPGGSYRGRYRMRYVDVGIKYLFHGTSFLFLEIKPEDSRKADGSKGRRSALATGAFFDF